MQYIYMNKSCSVYEYAVYINQHKYCSGPTDLFHSYRSLRLSECTGWSQMLFFLIQIIVGPLIILVSKYLLKNMIKDVHLNPELKNNACTISLAVQR